jgi:hypothetical protein
LSSALSITVECHAGYKADERPLRFRLTAPNAVAREVQEVLDQWYGPDYRCFKVRADDGNLYILRHDEATDNWTLDAYRENRGEPKGKG